MVQVTSTSAEELTAQQKCAAAFLCREIRVGICDGRVAVGTLLAFQGGGDLMLQNVSEERTLKDGLVMVRHLSLLAIPFKYVTSLHRRKEGELPLYPIEG